MRRRNRAEATEISQQRTHDTARCCRTFARAAAHAHNNAPTAPRSWLSPPVVLSAFFVLLGAPGTLLLRLYFVSGWPLLLPPLCLSLLHRGRAATDHLLPRRLAAAVAVLGAFFAMACFAYSLGSQALPLSTSSLLQATQLTFTAVSAFLFAGLRFVAQTPLDTLRRRVHDVAISSSPDLAITST
ncbi:hypothetical protein HU200_025603 [Digitaria exilis]|uniref:Uncharacterized protein n=1 Tax=Digitaria exilis TaxID=1010633 RepID=A0A835CA87_9POAL|nr:hypothetical protein HU200_025603 [Digitaria exilis]